ncbi:MAG: hypothetical protein R2684_17345 [Pyrinomonadaceae bacterium]
MKLAYKAFLLTLTIMALVFSASAQTLRPEKDPRNIAPTVGTGGPVGGPTGLFTVYDGQTLRKGEWTFSLAYSNFDRDPGNADVVEVPVSFQIGLNDYMELFFNTDAYRAVNVNSPRNLSSLYLPNASFGMMPAVILAPNGLLNGQYAGQAIYRPLGNQPFVPYPYTGGSAGTFWYLNGQQGNPVLGPPQAGGAASMFPGIGSVYGSILPGVVLSTVDVPVNNATGTRDLPTVFTVAPSYLADAPLIGRPYGTSSFSTYSVGAKIRFTGPNNPIGVGVIPFYRFYNDSAESVGGFGQLQRGASPGSRRGDIGIIAFGDARVRKWMNLSANVGYINNGSIKADGFTLLDRGDELLAAFGVDFPVNKYFQPIVEFRSLQYVGGRTFNTFENNPMDLIAGARVYPFRWMSLGAAYRQHLNQQDRDSLDGNTYTNFVTIPCFNPTGPGDNECSPQTIQTVSEGAPLGFRTSTDPHGFILQATMGRRNLRQDEIPNKPATINSVDLSRDTIKKPCPAGYRPREGETCDDDQTVNIRTSATDPENDVLTYNYTVSGGRIEGQGANVTWDLSGVSEGEYTMTVGVDDSCGQCTEPVTKTVTVSSCDCVQACDCGSLEVSGPPAVIKPCEEMTFRAEVSGGNQNDYTYNWTVSDGEIVRGQGTPTIVVGNTCELAGQTITATVDVASECEQCKLSGSETGIVDKKPEAVLIDEFGKIPNNDVKTRIDSLFIQLQSDPSATGYIINYGSAKDVRAREKLIRDYIAFRNYDADRVVFVNGGTESTIRTRLWVVPQGADTSNVNE